MFQLTINEKGGQSTAQTFDKNEITIGRVQGNDVVLPKGNISKRHSRIVLKDGKFIIVDLKSTNGTYVNGKKITAPQVIKATDKIYIGDYTLQLSNGAAGAAQPEARDASKGTAKNRDEVDLFGGDAANEAAEAPAGKSSAPGLIDENFDQEFDLAAEAAPKKIEKPAPSASAQKNRASAPKPAEPEPEPEPAEAEQELDLAADFPAEDDEPLAAEEAEAEREPPKAPVVPMKPPKKAPSAAPARSHPSRAKPQPSGGVKKPQAVEEEVPAGDEPSEPELEPQEGTPPGGIPAPAPTAKPAPVLPLPQPPHAPPPTALPTAPPVAAPQATPTAIPAAAAAAPPATTLDRPAALDALHVAVVDDLGLRGVELGELASHKNRALETARLIAARWQLQGRIARDENIEALAERAASRATDLEPIGELLTDEKVLQIAITHDRQVWVERDTLDSDRTLESEEAVIEVIHRLAVLGGAWPGNGASLFDVRLRDGSRVVASLPPLAFRGPTLSIRKSMRDAYNLESFVEAGTISESMMKFIELCVRSKKNVLLAVGPGVSASATLNAIASQMAEDERLVTIEGGVELHPLHFKNVTTLEPGPGASLGQLVRHATALQPDRVIIGNLNGPDAHEILVALAGPLDGSLAACYASTPAQAVERLAHVALAKDFPDAPAAARRLVATAFPVVLQEHRFPEGGSRRITQISELVVDGDEVGVHDIFVFRPDGLDDNGVLSGSFAPTGYEPRFVQELVDRGDEVDMEIFKE